MATLIRGDGRQVTAYQDAVGFNFAFRGKTGYVSNIGNNCRLEKINGDKAIKIGSGMVVIQGRQIMFDGTDEISLPTYQGTTIHSTIYVELNMAITKDSKQGEVTIKRIDSTTSKPGIPPSDDLFKIPTGKAYFQLGGVEINGANNPILLTGGAMYPNAKVEADEQSNFGYFEKDGNGTLLFDPDDYSLRFAYALIFHDGRFLTLIPLSSTSGTAPAYGTFYKTTRIYGGEYKSFEYAYKIKKDLGTITLSIAEMPAERPSDLSTLTYEKVTRVSGLIIY